ncbi:hypothetical protein LAZ67_22000061 [Cordylochernes scorpioides]|uniref:Uncharacterized protein n=1 Tax=Cordylochernes scorpioides TaxID=51811 RepID=A0ABY6LN48_9ARAC|nr:hypothetical protein LAZ67_22000061 [Cordylochernes scorpioides]
MEQCQIHDIATWNISKDKLHDNTSDHTFLRSPLDPWNIRPNSGMFRFRDSPEMKNVYKEATMDISNVRRWMKIFRSGETSLDDKPRKKICLKWVPRKLTPDQRDQRVQLCQELLVLYEAQKDAFSNIVIGGETWAYLYDP